MEKKIRTRYPKLPVTIRLKESTLSQITKMAEINEMDRSEFLRRVVENYVKMQNLEM